MGDDNHASAMQVRLRPEIDALPRYVPGRSFPRAAKLSSNENPHPPTSGVVLAASHALNEVNRYPDLTSAHLRSALANDLKVTPEHLCVSTGSSAVLLAALMAVCGHGSSVVYPWRSFESYPIAVPAAGGVPRGVPLLADGTHDLDAMTQAIGADTAAVILCSPNNPTGTALRLEEIRRFLAAVPAQVLVIIDEAYIEMANADGVSSAIPLIAEFANVLVLRTFSKVYALAGLRVGYGVGHPELISAITAVTVPFGVSSVAQAAAQEALADREALRATVEWIVGERERVGGALEDQGWVIPQSQSNFFWLSADQSGPQFVKACEEAGLIVRPFPEGVRVSLGTPQDNDRLLEVAAEFIARTRS